ncbi:MAG TPA: two-component regulator propeller domain-containing protein [Candidatus Paceibacterota bacterium]|nr:two-component regulator propeller domain-containing protein [Candidatus Paceibacterota bacterium]
MQCLGRRPGGRRLAGTVQDGLVCLLPRRIRTLAAEDGLPDPKTRALVEASDGTLWVGTDGGAVQMGGNQPRVLNTSSGLASDLVRALAEDAQGRVCIETVSGLSVWDGQTLERMVYPGADYRTKIRALLRDNDFPSVLGSTEADSEGRDPRVPDSNRLQSPNRALQSSALGEGQVPGHKGALWIGTAQGLYRLGSDQTNGWLVADGLPHMNACVVHQDRRGRVWIGTDGGGLARCTDTGFERFDESKGLSSSRVYALYDDADGALWIGTDRGLNVLLGDRIAVLTSVNGLGLASMRERMVSLGGLCEVQSRPGAGTKVIFRAPLPSA